MQHSPGRCRKSDRAMSDHQSESPSRPIALVVSLARYVVVSGGFVAFETRQTEPRAADPIACFQVDVWGCVRDVRRWSGTDRVCPTFQEQSMDRKNSRLIRGREVERPFDNLDVLAGLVACAQRIPKVVQIRTMVVGPCACSERNSGPQYPAASISIDPVMLHMLHDSANDSQVDQPLLDDEVRLFVSAFSPPSPFPSDPSPTRRPNFHLRSTTHR